MIQHDNLGRILIMEAEAAKLIGAGIAVLPLLGVGIGIGNSLHHLDLYVFERRVAPALGRSAKPIRREAVHDPT